jgi:ATP-dependent Clp protease ATP-binding subunit ClpA
MNGFNFTDRVRKVLQIAREEALRLRHEFVGTEHILLAVIREGEGVAMAVLTNLNVDAEEMSRDVEAALKQGRTTPSGDLELPYTSRAKKVLELAMSAARELNHSYVGSEHLLLGLLGEEKGIAAQFLNRAGVTLELARTETLRLLGGAPPGSPGSARVTPSHDEVRFVFSPPVSKVLGLARSAAVATGRPAIDTEHILIGMLAEHGHAMSILESLNVSTSELSRRLAPKEEREAPSERRTDIPYVPNAKRAVWLAVVEAVALRHETVGSGHLLLGLLCVPGAARDLLTGLGVSEDLVRKNLEHAH